MPMNEVTVLAVEHEAFVEGFDVSSPVVEVFSGEGHRQRAVLHLIELMQSAVKALNEAYGEEPSRDLLAIPENDYDGLVDGYYLALMGHDIHWSYVLQSKEPKTE